MKTSSFFALVKNDLRVVWSCFPLVVFYAYLGMQYFRRDQMFDLQPVSGGESFLFIVPFMMWNFLFENQSYGLKQGPRAPLASFEFMFTRAIDRVSLFSAKTTLFLLIALLAPALIWAYSYTAPVIRLEIPYNTLQHREETKQFFLTHFDGAYLQQPDDGRNQDYVVLPHGRTAQAATGLLFCFVFTLLFQVILFSFKRLRWIPLVALFLIVMVTAFVGISRTTPSPYEAGVAWVSQHALLTFIGVGLLTVLAQFYCCRRFVNTEITS